MCARCRLGRHDTPNRETQLAGIPGHTTTAMRIVPRDLEEMFILIRLGMCFHVEPRCCDLGAGFVETGNQFAISGGDVEPCGDRTSFKPWREIDWQRFPPRFRPSCGVL